MVAKLDQDVRSVVPQRAASAVFLRLRRNLNLRVDGDKPGHDHVERHAFCSSDAFRSGRVRRDSGGHLTQRRDDSISTSTEFMTKAPIVVPHDGQSGDGMTSSANRQDSTGALCLPHGHGLGGRCPAAVGRRRPVPVGPVMTTLSSYMAGQASDLCPTRSSRWQAPYPRHVRAMISGRTFRQRKQPSSLRAITQLTPRRRSPLRG